MGVDAGSAHIGGKLNAYYSTKSQSIHINGLGHLGLLIGGKAGVDVQIPVGRMYNFVFD